MKADDRLSLGMLFTDLGLSYQVKHVEDMEGVWVGSKYTLSNGVEVYAHENLQIAITGPQSEGNRIKQAIENDLELAHFRVSVI